MSFNQPGFDQQLNEQFERISKTLSRLLPKLLPIAAGLIVILWLSSGMYSVNPGQVGVVRTFGKETARTWSKSAESKWVSVARNASMKKP